MLKLFSKKNILLSLFVVVLFMPIISLAQVSPSPSSTTVGGLNYGAGAGKTSFSGFQDYMNTVLPWVLSIGSALSLLMIVYGGFKYITSQGQPDQLTAAKNIIFSTIIGFILLVMMSYILDIFLQRI